MRCPLPPRHELSADTYGRCSVTLPSAVAPLPCFCAMLNEEASGEGSGFVRGPYTSAGFPAEAYSLSAMRASADRQFVRAARVHCQGCAARVRGGDVCRQTAPRVASGFLTRTAWPPLKGHSRNTRSSCLCWPHTPTSHRREPWKCRTSRCRSHMSNPWRVWPPNSGASVVCVFTAYEMPGQGFQAIWTGVVKRGQKCATGRRPTASRLPFRTTMTLACTAM